MRITLRENKNALKLFKNTLNKRLIKLGKAVIHDSVHEPPTPAIRTGFLKGSHFIFTQKFTNVGNPDKNTNHTPNTPLSLIHI